ncbi:uracil phosphoribosyltransferase [candidate division WWE3 bacterium CG06_land_8_20_14_3_00_42_16]|uniref:Uracil phosphoribosyltransferase n=2 Tax=Katanobacteria TaxID=422282 RepID=A0A2M7ANL0_UNCKA|nr:MAG: uracil phosphoribosyltransferase [candidate division WWE3 bacterium CG06_land_8_20_14_3_00_42_16]
MFTPTENVFVSGHPLILHKLTLLRDKGTEPKKFRELLHEIAMLLLYEATADLALESRTVQTPLTLAEGYHLSERIGLVPILRAGLGMAEGIHEMMPGAQVWHLGLYRDERTLRPVTYYNKLPTATTVQVCLILDPMLATGGSATAAVDILKHWGAQRIKFVGIIGAPEGVERLHTEHPDVAIHLAAIDKGLTDGTQHGPDGQPLPPGYIWEGLGDAGDRQFGTGNGPQ